MLSTMMVLLVTMATLAEAGSVWTEWSGWSKCTSTCGSGLQMRGRSCDKTTSDTQGQSCMGDGVDVRVCGEWECPAEIQGGWTKWGPWTTCTQTCGGGFMLRERQCTNPDPGPTGRYCVGEGHQIGGCNSDTCPDVGSEFVGFSVQQRETVTTSGVLPFPHGHYNTNGHFHYSDSSFHAPVKGTYLFAVSAVKGGTTRIHLTLRSEFTVGPDAGGNVSVTSATVYSMDQHAGVTLMMPMYTQEKVYLYQEPGSSVGKETYFSGMLLTKSYIYTPGSV